MPDRDIKPENACDPTADATPSPPYDPRQGVIDWLEARIGAKAWDAVTREICEGEPVQWCSRTGTAALHYGGGATDPSAINRAATNLDGKWHAGQDFLRLEAWARAQGAWHEPGDGYTPQKGDALFVLRDAGRQLHYATVELVAPPGDIILTIEGNTAYSGAAPHGQIARSHQVYSRQNVRGLVDVGALLDAGIVPVEPLPAA